MGRDKSLQARLEEPDLGAAADHEPTRHQPLPAPARHRAGRHVVPPTHLVHRQDRLVDLLDRLARRRRQVFDEQPQVMLNIAAIKNQGRPTVGAKPRDPVTQDTRKGNASPPRSHPGAARPARLARAAVPAARTASAGLSVASSRDGGTLLPILVIPPTLRGPSDVPGLRYPPTHSIRCQRASSRFNDRTSSLAGDEENRTSSP